MKREARIRRSKGITLIALVITIVILIILSTIAINMAFGDNGLVKYAEQASDYAANDEAATSGMLNSAVSYIDNITNPETATTVVDAKGGNLYKDTKAITDEIGNTVYIPGGFKVASDSATKVEDGIVIEDSKGNQFVWIPVSSTELAEMYTEAPGTALSRYTGVDTTTGVYSKLKSSTDGSSGYGGIPGSTTYREPDILIDTSYGDASTTNGIDLIKSVFGYEGSNAEILDQFADMLVANYEEAYKSIKEYGGFYIGRYELTGSVASPTVQKGQTVLANQNWYKSYKACSNVVNTDFAKSTMIAGTQWDRVLEWLVDTGEKSSSEVYSNSSSWGNYNNSTGEAVTGSGSKRQSGYNEAWKANNIYDLAGNCWEWTQEAIYTDVRVFRGGYYNDSGSSYPASSRYHSYPYYADSNISSRVALYVGLNVE